jgi:nucleoside-diphosphate-sugar epimerase
MSIETVAVTGGEGFIGSEIVDVLNERGYRTASLDLGRGGSDADEFREVDLTDAGQTYGALAVTDADAVVHMGTIIHPVSHPEHVVFESNAMTGYHVLEAAQNLDVEAACLASSVHAHGWGYQAAEPDIEYVPIDEEHPVTPRDPYALGKHVTEELCDGFARRDGAPARLGTFRFPGVMTTDQLRRKFVEHDRSLEGLREYYDRSDNPGLTYVHVRDAARLVADVVEADYEGHERFWTVASDTTAEVATEEFLAEFYPEIEVRGDLSGHDALISNAKAKQLLGWEDERSWRDL